MAAAAGTEAWRPVAAAVTNVGAVMTCARGNAAMRRVLTLVALARVAVRVTLQVRLSEPGTPARKVTWRVPAPAVMVPLVTLHW